jgi:hypothetical protein
VGGTLLVDQLAAEGKRVVIFHENWSRFQGYPDPEQIPKLKLIADACHARGMIFLVYFGGLMSDAAPEWRGMEGDFMALPERKWYHRDDVVQDCYVSCVNGPFGPLLLNGIRRLADEAGIDGVYMDGTTVPWDCANPTHPGCGQYDGAGGYSATVPLRATREFMKRLRGIFAGRERPLFLDAHTGGSINTATLSFCDGFFDGETLSRYKQGYRLSPEIFCAGYMGKQFGIRADFLASRIPVSEGEAVSLVHDTEARGQPAAVDLALAPYEDEETRFLPYWSPECPVKVTPGTVLGSAYVRPERALVVIGNQRDETASCSVDIRALLDALPAGPVAIWDPIKGEAIAQVDGTIELDLAGRGWQMIELLTTAQTTP